MKKSMISKVASVVLVAGSMALVGCGGGGGDSTPTQTSTSTTTSGTGSDGYINLATVCLDMNVNGVCDNGEPVSSTDENGSYTLTITAAQQAAANANAPILLVGGIDVDSKKSLAGALKAPFSAGVTSANITPLSTMVTALVKNNVSIDEAYTKVAQAVGLSADEVKADPVKLAKEGKKEVLAAAMTLHRIVSTMATAAGDANNTAAIYSGLTTAIEKASTDTNNSVATLVIAAANDANSTLPQEAKDAAVVAPLIESQIETAVVDSNASLADAAIVADAAVEVISESIVTAIDNNETIDDAFISSVEDNATTTASNVDPVLEAIKNIFASYSIVITDTEVNTIKSALAVNSSSDVTVSAILDVQEGSVLSAIGQLETMYIYQQIRSYTLNLGYQISDTAIADIAMFQNPDASPAFNPTMTANEFAAMVYSAGETYDNAELMTLALQINPPADVASLSDVEKSKALFESVRTQFTNIETYAKGESASMDSAFNSVAMNIDYVADVFNFMQEGITYAMDTNQTSASAMLGDRNITITNNDTASNVKWDYTIVDANTNTTWSGSLTYTNVDPDTFDPSNFSTVTANLTGNLPLDYTAVTGVTDSQDVTANVTITKTTEGAQFNIDAELASNGDSVKLTDAQASVAYDVNSTTGEPIPTYVKLDHVYVDGQVGVYTLNGKLDVKSYVQNTQMAQQGGIEIETSNSWFGVELTCSGDTTGTIDPVGITFNSSQPAIIDNYGSYDSTNNITYYALFFNDIPGDLNQSAVTDINNYGGVSSCNSANIILDNYGSWTDYQPNNSGYVPSEITFAGKVTNTTNNTYLDASIDAKWLDAATATNVFEDPEYTPSLDVTLNGTLSMPESHLLTVSVRYTNEVVAATNTTPSYVKDIFDATYAYDTTSITGHVEMDDVNKDVVDLSSASGIKAHVVLNNDNSVDTTASTLTNSTGDTIGTFENISDVPRVKYVDGSFESLP